MEGAENALGGLATEQGIESKDWMILQEPERESRRGRAREVR